MFLEVIYIRPKVKSKQFEISNFFERLFRLHGNFTSVDLEISNPFEMATSLQHFSNDGKILSYILKW